MKVRKKATGSPARPAQALESRESKLKPDALKAAGWGLMHGDFFDHCDLAEAFDIPHSYASKVLAYLRQLACVELKAETRSGPREKGKAIKRIFIKVISIHPEPPKLIPTPAIHQKLARLARAMPAPK